MKAYGFLRKFIMAVLAGFSHNNCGNDYDNNAIKHSDREGIGYKTADEAQVADYYMSDGTLVDSSEQLTDLQKKNCIGVVFALASDAGENDKSKYKSLSKVHGYVVALHDAHEGNTYNFKWSPDNTTAIKGVINNDESNPTDWSGYKNTQAILAKYSTETDIAAHVAKNYTPEAPSNSSGWFLPSIAQLVAAYKAVIPNGGAYTSYANVKGADLQANVFGYNSSTEVSRYSLDEVYIFALGCLGYRFIFNKNSAFLWVRPVLAF